jgi:two-component system OmpR family sensor kinase
VPRWSFLRSLRNRLAIVFFAITLTALAALYVYVVPQLSSRLRDEKVQTLKGDARRESSQLAATVGRDVNDKDVAALVGGIANSTSTRVTLLRVARVGLTPQLSVAHDSQTPRAADLQFPAAYEAASSGRITTGTETGAFGRVAEVAMPLKLRGRVAAIAVFSSQLADVQHDVAVVRRRLLFAGALAAVFSLAAGYLVARWLTQRIKRLEAAAEKVAAGDFSQPIPVSSDDELGQLALAFNDMQRQLAQLDSARKQFIATASHELRTPITSLGGFIELLESEEVDEDTRRRFLGQLREQVDRLTKLAVDLLDLSRLEAGSLELRPEPTDLGELARQVADEFEPALDRHDSQLELRLARRPVEVVCDPVRVAQIMRILLDNALAHTASGTGIVVSAAWAPDGAAAAQSGEPGWRAGGHAAGVARLAVRDGGEGIRRQDLSRVFEPFHTGNRARGSGLGLAIASELADRMEGRLDVESRPGRTVFTLELPA